VLAIALYVLLTTSALPLTEAQTLSVLHSFSGSEGDHPFSGVILDQAGNLYGTTFSGGSRDAGTAFQLKHSAFGYTLNSLYTFNGGSTGGSPEGGVVFGPDGALYGTTSQDGFDGSGTVFRLRPPATFCRAILCPWTEEVLYAFHGVGSGDGAHPAYGDVVFDAAGNIYGTTSRGGSFGGGTVYELSPSGSGWTETILYNFGATGDGSQPMHNVIFDRAGNLYGTTANGGADGNGTVFQLVRSSSGWIESFLYSFPASGSAGVSPQAGLIFDQTGNLYGATTYGNAAVFELSPSAGGWQFTLLHTFAQHNIGPIGNLVMDNRGHLYGTTYGDGATLQGSIFELTPSVGGWTFTELYDFADDSSGANPSGDLTLDNASKIYGTTQIGSNGGTVWTMLP
jgi:uncharacterized repeat protein (TIGR03803 family)